MSDIVRATTPEVPEPPAGTWSNCLVTGGIAYVAGMTARGDDTAGDEYVQAKAIFGKIRHLVEAAGGTMADIVKLTVYLCDMGDVKEVAAARARYFSPPYPASTMIEVSRLVSPDQLVEIEAVAALAPRRPPDSPARDLPTGYLTSRRNDEERSPRRRHDTA